MNEYERKAHDLFLSGYNCAQAVAAAFSEKMGMDEKTVLKMASGFGGGMGRMREVCGAVSAMTMVLSNLYGYNETDDDEKKALYSLVQKCCERFKNEYKTIICKTLLGLDGEIKPEPTPTKRSEEFYKKRPCLGYVVCAASILSDVISEKENF